MPWFLFLLLLFLIECIPPPSCRLRTAFYLNSLVVYTYYNKYTYIYIYLYNNLFDWTFKFYWAPIRMHCHLWAPLWLSNELFWMNHIARIQSECFVCTSELLFTSKQTNKNIDQLINHYALAHQLEKRWHTCFTQILIAYEGIQLTFDCIPKKKHKKLVWASFSVCCMCVCLCVCVCLFWTLCMHK